MRDKRALEGFLSRDRIAACYALCDLDEPYWSQSLWHTALDGEGRIEALALEFTAYDPPALLTFGSAAGVAELVSSDAKLPRSHYVHMLLPHEEAMRSIYEYERLKLMRRMALVESDFRPAECEGIVRLGSGDVGEMIELYRHYPGHFFQPSQLEMGVYYGVRSAGMLVAVSGTHVITESQGLAALGNIVTQPDFRGRGLAKAATSAVCRELFSAVDLVCLNVADDNAPGIAAYEAIGFRTHSHYLEGLGQARQKAGG
jgi:ribosomal protein S18 acetylase RimI-like enzyme